VITNMKGRDKKLMRYIRQYNKLAAPLKWKYSDPTRRIRCDSSGSVSSSRFVAARLGCFGGSFARHGVRGDHSVAPSWRQQISLD